MSGINPSLIDCRFEFTGMIGVGDLSFGQEFRSEWVIDRKDWRDWYEQNASANANLVRYNLKINNQNPESSCVCNAAETCFRSVWTRQLGVKYSIDLSPMSLYARICSSRHSGSYMVDALNESKERGFLPESSEKNKKLFRHTLHQNTPWIRPSQLPSGWEQTAKHFRPIEWYRLPDDRDAFGSALLQGMPICYGRDGHSIAAMELVFDNNRWFAKIAQSYGTSTGDQGYQYDSERMWATGGAWCLRSVTLPDDPAKPAGADGL